jgi:DNA-binding transcriptional regulator YiaG
MTPTQYAAAIERLGLSQVAAARFFGVGDRTCRRWISGEYEVPPAVTYCLSLMIRHDVKPGDLDKKFKK